MPQYSQHNTVTHTVNVLPALALISGLIGLFCWATGASFWWMVLPFALWLGLVLSLWFMAFAFMFIIWLCGGRVVFKHRDGRKRAYRHFRRVP